MIATFAERDRLDTRCVEALHDATITGNERLLAPRVDATDSHEHARWRVA